MNRKFLLSWALAASFLAFAGIWESVRCRGSAAPQIVEIPKIEIREVVKEKRVPGKPLPGVVLAGGVCADWSDEDERFHFDQKKRELETHQEFKAAISEDRKQATVQEVSPKTGEVLRTTEIPIKGLTAKPPYPKWRLEAGLMAREGGDWNAFGRVTYRPSRFTFVSAEMSDDNRIYGGVAIDF